MRWGRRFRFFRDEVVATMTRVDSEEASDEDAEQPEETDGDQT